MQNMSRREVNFTNLIMSRFNRNSSFNAGNSAPPPPSLRIAHQLNTCRKTGVLNLSNLDLQSLPTDAYDLRKAVLDNTAGVDGMKAWEIYGEEMVTSIDLSDNPLTSLSMMELAVYESCAKIRALRCNLRDFDWNGLAKLQNLHTIDLSNNELKGDFPLDALPASIAEVNVTGNAFSGKADTNYATCAHTLLCSHSCALFTHLRSVHTLAIPLFTHVP